MYTAENVDHRSKLVNTYTFMNAYAFLKIDTITFVIIKTGSLA